jgi:hypothetical protein
VERVEAIVQPASVDLRLYSRYDVDIEQWQAGQVSPDFAQVYGVPLSAKIKR